MRFSYRTSAVLIVMILVSSSHAFGVAISDSAVGTYAPNPTPLVMSDAASNTAANGSSLANFRTLITSAFAANTGGDASNDAATCPAAGPCNCSGTEHFALLQASKGVISTADATIVNIGGLTFPPTGLNPPGGSLAATAPRADCTTLDSSFVSAPYIGAFAPGGSDWTAGWTAYPFN